VLATPYTVGQKSKPHNFCNNFINEINYENYVAVDKVIAKIIRLTSFGPPCREMNELWEIVDSLFFLFPTPHFSVWTGHFGWILR